MPIELTEEQQRAVANPSEVPPRVIDPRTNKTFVLLEAEQYERIKTLMRDGFDIRDAYPLMDAVAAKEGWDDPALDIYEDLDPRNKP